MKKNLLSLSFILSLGTSVFSQDTYINDAVTVKVNPNTLFFHGGSVNVKTSNISGATQKIVNDGNIQINGNFTNENTLGKNFVNTYTNGSNFGQLIINQESTGITGNLTMERSKLNIDNAYYPTGLPFQTSQINDIINNMVGETNAFAGNCTVNFRCQYRYNQTILLWDIEETEYDAVPHGSIVKPGGSYTIRLNGGRVRTFMENLQSATKFSLFGIPNNNKFQVSNVKSKIRNFSEQEFSDKTWAEWKTYTNNYNETYQSYIDNYIESNNENVLYGKNLHRFSNPFTSNLDLSIINKPNDGSGLTSWLTFNINGGIIYPTEAFEQYLRFQVSKLPIELMINWSSGFGATNTTTATKRISAYLQKSNNINTPYFWAGAAEALLIKPFEYFEVDYYALNPSSITNPANKIVNANYSITDQHKTFSQTYMDIDGSGIYARNNNIINNDELQHRGFIGPNDFTQIEFYLTKNNTILDEAAYLVNSSFYNTGNVRTNRELNNKLFLFEESADGIINRNSQTLLNEFKNDYIGKPLGIGFKDLENGEQYSVKLRLFEYSILNEVNNLNNGTYYLYDRNTNQISEINGDSEITFIADENINNRFELYWNEVPRTLATDDLSVLKTTNVYYNNNHQYVRFENNNTKATIKVFDLTGRLIVSHINVNTSDDFKLNLDKGSAIYIVNITYENGKTVSKKIIQN